MSELLSVSPSRHEPQDTVSRWKRESWLAPRLVAACLAAVILSLLGERFSAADTTILVLNIVSYLAGGFFGAKTAIESLRQGEIDVDLLMVLAALGAAFIGEWHEGAVLLFLFSLSNVLQDYAIGRSRRAISGLFDLYPEEATVKRGDRTSRVNLSEIAIGDIVLIQPGERIPVDGLVVAGDSAVDESPISGESLPVDKVVGDNVFAGTLNKQGILDVRAMHSAEQTTLSRIIRLVEEAQESKAPTQRFLDRFEQTYAKAIILSIMLLIVIPPALGISDFESNFYRAMVLMTVASPCALVISVPSAFISAIASAARNGLLFKGGASLEQLADVKVVAFDKTGTLTIGQPKVTDIVISPPYSTDDLIQTAASIEARSEHPLAQAIVDHAQSAGVELLTPKGFEAIPGQGVRARLEGKAVRIGRITQLQQTAPLPAELAGAQSEMEAAGKTVVAVLREDQWLGLIALADEERSESPPLIKSLSGRGIVTVMLTGDNSRVAHSIASKLGIDRVYAELLPDQKAQIVQDLQNDYGSVAMVGDGINDAPALAAAEVGIAMGGGGADVALETSDLVLMGDRIERLTDAIRLAKRAKQVVWQNILFSLGVIVLLVAGVLAVALPLPLGVLGHEGSTVIVVLNGLISLLILPEIRRQRMQRLS